MRRIAVLALSAVACHATPPGTGTNAVVTTTPSDPGCTETVTPLALADVSPLGFSGEDVAAVLDEYLYTPGLWVVLGEPADVMIHPYDFEDPVFHDLTGADCVDWLEIPATVQFESYLPAGGADIHPQGTVAASDLLQMTATATIDADQAGLDAAEVGIDLSEFDEAEAVLTTSWIIGEPTENSGTLEGSATRASDGSTFSGVVASWPE